MKNSAVIVFHSSSSSSSSSPSDIHIVQLEIKIPANKWISVFKAAAPPAQPTAAFRILAFGIYVTHFRIVTGSEKHCCQQVCPSIVRSSYKITIWQWTRTRNGERTAQSRMIRWSWRATCWATALLIRMFHCWDPCGFFYIQGLLYKTIQQRNVHCILQQQHEKV